MHTLAIKGDGRLPLPKALTKLGMQHPTHGAGGETAVPVGDGGGGQVLSCVARPT